MATMVATETKGLFQRGSRWWIRWVRSPLSRQARALSTGTDNPELAGAIAAMVQAWSDDGSERQREWLDRAVRGEVSLLELYTRAKRGELDALGAELRAAARERDLDAVVEEWIAQDLATRKDCRARTLAEYQRYVRYFIPAGARFPASRLTEQYVRDRLAALRGARADASRAVSGGTQRNYLVGLQQFVRYALRRHVLADDPLAFAFGKHGWAAKRRARAVYYEFPVIRSVLAHVEDAEARAALALIFGSGIECGGLLNQRRMHIRDTMPDGRGTVIVPGRDSSRSHDDRKNEFRSERTIFVDAWAWAIVKPYVDALPSLPRAPLWSWSPATKGKRLREIFYRAQVAAGVLEEPPRSARGNPRWDAVQPHTLHDARHSYCVNRSLGLDGEPARSAAFCAAQLGHSTEQMVHTIYKKAGIEERVRTLQLAEAMRQAASAVPVAVAW